MSTPAPEAAEQLGRDGVVIVTGVLEPAAIERGCALLDEIYARPRDLALDAPGYSVDSGAAGEPILALPDGTRFVTNLVSKDAFFADLIDDPTVLGLVRSLIPDPVLSSLNSLEPVLGSGHQTLHRDEGPVGPEGVVTINTLWLFDDVDADNGATRYVPGTQVTDELAEPERVLHQHVVRRVRPTVVVAGEQP